MASFSWKSVWAEKNKVINNNNNNNNNNNDDDDDDDDDQKNNLKKLIRAPIGLISVLLSPTS